MCALRLISDLGLARFVRGDAPTFCQNRTGRAGFGGLRVLEHRPRQEPKSTDRPHILSRRKRWWGIVHGLSVDKAKPERGSMDPVGVMEDDFDRRREIRRQKREEMRLEAERFQRTEDDEEEAARERRRRARQERLRTRDNEEVAATATESTEINNTNSVTETGTVVASEDDQVLLDRLAKREERRQRRMKEALERQKELDPTVDDGNDNGQEERPEGRDRGEEEEELNNKAPETNAWKEEKKEEAEEAKPQEEEAAAVEEEAATEEPAAEPEEEAPQEEVEEKPRRSYLREQAIEGKSKRSSMREQEAVEEKTKRSFRKEDVFEKKVKEVTPPSKQQNGAVHDSASAKHKKPERTLSRGSARSPEVEEQDDAARQEAERKLEELKRRRDDAESEEFEKMRHKQQEAEVELEELKKKREERRKVLEEEEKQRKQEREEKKAKEEEEKRKMKEEIERRRAEAAEKRQKVEELGDGETKKPFKCVSPRGSSLKIGERAEFLNKSAQKSTVKTTHVPVVSKIDNRLEQYTTALQSSKDPKSPKSAAPDLPVVTDGIRNIKSMWEKGNAFSSPGSPGNTNKEAAGMKIGVAGRINDWLNKTPEPGKTAGGMPADLKPGDVTNKRSLWENKGTSPTKVAVGGKSKAVTNAGAGH
ncbi:hypothetical protein SKAU_G00036200 [Synaphobranchus kaupii]|uniref:Non-muscle caldesmon n=1 Tax=Synaphobranchus kaupii TaxID=118154 RepID=A0A9Q1JGP0_SYNKA|nr:hypothetical protein SKAU_G00036200 [Synaphobranchus kaupii]